MAVLHVFQHPFSLIAPESRESFSKPTTSVVSLLLPRSLPVTCDGLCFCAANDHVLLEELWRKNRRVHMIEATVRRDLEPKQQ